MANPNKAREATRRKVRGKRVAVRKALRKKRPSAAARAVKACFGCAVGLALVLACGCNLATPASKSAGTRACDNVTTVNNHFGLVVIPTNGGVPVVVGLAGPVTVNVSDVNGTIAQSADTEGGDRTDLAAVPTLSAGVTGDKPIKAVADAVSAFASPAGAADAALSALVKRFGLESATNAVAGAVGTAFADGGVNIKRR